MVPGRLSRQLHGRSEPRAAPSVDRLSCGVNPVSGDRPTPVEDRAKQGNERVRSAEHVKVDVLPRDITTLPHVLGSDLIEYLTAASTEAAGKPHDWDAFAEAAGVIDPDEWYTTSFDATPGQSITRWFPSDRSGLATVAVYSQASESTVLIRYGDGGPSIRHP